MFAKIKHSLLRGSSFEPPQQPWVIYVTKGASAKTLKTKNPQDFAIGKHHCPVIK